MEIIKHAYWILSSDIITMLVVLRTVLYAGNKVFRLHVLENDYCFYLLIFIITVAGIFGNSLAMYNDLMRFFIRKEPVLEEMALTRYGDRVCMLLVFSGIYLLSRKYIPHWMLKKHPC